MSVSAAQFQSLIITRLTSADVSASSALTARVPVLWTLYARKAAVPELRYWYVYREAVKLVMGCVRAEIDRVRLARVADGVSSSRESSDSLSQSQNTAESTGLSDASMSMSASGVGSGSHSNSFSNNYSSSGAFSASESKVDAGSGSGATLNRETVSGDHTMRKRTFNESGFDGTLHDITGGVHSRVEYSGDPAVPDSGYIVRDEETDGGGSDLLIIGGAYTHTHRTWSEHHNHSIAQSSLFTHDRNGGIRTQHTGHDDTTVSDDTLDSFTANVVESGSGSGSRTANGSGSTALHASENRSASGSSTTTEHAESQSGAQGTSKAADTSLAERTSVNDSQTHYMLQRFQQRFLNLQKLWTNATRTIEFLEAQGIISNRYLLEAMIAKYPDGLCADEANSYVFKGTPWPLRPSLILNNWS